MTGTREESFHTKDHQSSRARDLVQSQSEDGLKYQLLRDSKLRQVAHEQIRIFLCKKSVNN